MKQKITPVVRTIPADRLTPTGIAKKLNAAVLLESSSYRQGKARYSILLADRAFMLLQEKDRVVYEDEKGRRNIRGQEGDILDVMEHFASRYESPVSGIPFPAGGACFLSYEFARRCDSFRIQERPDPAGLPEAAAVFAHTVLVFDHYTDVLYLIGLNYRHCRIDLEKRLDMVESRIRDMDFNYLNEDEKAYPAELLKTEGEREWFLDGVEKVRTQIIEGNLLQGVLSRRKTYRTALPSFEAYRRLKRANPSPYMFHIDFGSYQIFGTSPEMHVRVKGGKAQLKPIAGTRKRGKDPAEDLRLEAELSADPKEKAEHLMLVDLARNDLSRFCRAGSVKVDSFMNPERYSHVIHLVSEVSGTVEEGVKPSRIIRATFPAGTVSGAPKIRAVEIIDGLEPHPRGFYAGLVGYMEPDGLDTCITIRSALKKDGLLHLQAGAGIVYDSVPEKEYEETEQKLAALVRASGAEEEMKPTIMTEVLS